MTDKVVEIAGIRLAPGRSEAELIAASEAFQREFLNGQPGFLRRELLRSGEGRYIDLVHWQDSGAAAAVMERAAGSEACGRYFALMEMDPASPGEGVSHHVSLGHWD